MHNLNELDMCIDLTPAELEELKGGGDPTPQPSRAFSISSISNSNVPLSNINIIDIPIVVEIFPYGIVEPPGGWYFTPRLEISGTRQI